MTQAEAARGLRDIQALMERGEWREAITQVGALSIDLEHAAEAAAQAFDAEGPSERIRSRYQAIISELHEGFDDPRDNYNHIDPTDFAWYRIALAGEHDPERLYKMEDTELADHVAPRLEAAGLQGDDLNRIITELILMPLPTMTAVIERLEIEQS